MATDVYVSVGSNIDPVENLQVACRELERSFGALELSSVYQTAPVGFDGTDFLNMVISFSTDQGWERIRSTSPRAASIACIVDSDFVPMLIVKTPGC